MVHQNLTIAIATVGLVAQSLAPRPSSPMGVLVGLHRIGAESQFVESGDYTPPSAGRLRTVWVPKVFWTYHVNMRLAGRYISRDELIEATETYEIN
ncbi:MAG: hypothetical protein HW416_3548 [Chloroflexi bacterium]|nr:hypothetical protein [Chloroflexota bacterium]